jgi:hypothetical protein
MRRVVPAGALVVVAALALSAPAGGGLSATGGGLGAKRVNLRARLSARVPAGWHVLRGWLSDVLDPAPRLAVASFPVRLSRRTCGCGFPNVVDWEYLHPSRRGLARTPSRPVRFGLVGGGVRHTCEGPSDTFAFKQAGRVFQVAVYLGPRVAPAVRSRMAELLDSFQAATGR